MNIMNIKKQHFVTKHRDCYITTLPIQKNTRLSELSFFEYYATPHNNPKFAGGFFHSWSLQRHTSRNFTLFTYYGLNNIINLFKWRWFPIKQKWEMECIINTYHNSCFCDIL